MLPAAQPVTSPGAPAPRPGGGGRRSPASHTSRASRAFVAAGMALAGCGGDGAADLEGRSFASTQARGHELVGGSQVTLTFADGRISANAGCNTMTGAATWADGTLELGGPLASTMMACDDALMAQDRWLSDLLESSPDLALDGDELTLGDESTGLTLSQSS